jgi:hypothetical protein
LDDDEEGVVEAEDIFLAVIGKNKERRKKGSYSQKFIALCNDDIFFFFFFYCCCHITIALHFVHLYIRIEHLYITHKRSIVLLILRPCVLETSLQLVFLQRQALIHFVKTMLLVLYDSNLFIDVLELCTESVFGQFTLTLFLFQHAPRSTHLSQFEPTLCHNVPVLLEMMTPLRERM